MSSAAGVSVGLRFGPLASYAARVRPSAVSLALDSVVVVLSIAAATLLRFDGQPPVGMWPKALACATVMALALAVIGKVTGMYGQVWSYAGAAEARRILLTGIVATLSCTVLTAAAAWLSPRDTSTVGPLVSVHSLPLAVPLTGGLIATGILGLTRYHSRLFATHRLGSQPTGTRTLVVGAGDIGVWLVRQAASTRAFQPVGFADDDPAKLGMRIAGVEVLGVTSDIAGLVAQHRIEQVIIAIGSPSSDHLKAVAVAARQGGAEVKTVPTVAEILLRGMRPDDLRSLETEPLLGRAAVRTDLGGVHDFIRGRTVLVTGGGGSIGSEIARQVAAAGPGRLLVLDHDETHLHDLRADLPERITTYLLADIRDADAVGALLDLHRPTVVFHAAALKHVPILEEYPFEAVQTNILGTQVLLEACAAVDVENFTLISTDKAVAPSSVMGATKRVAEMLVADIAGRTGGRYVSVRFGNVLGSRGSVVPTFARQIRQGGPVTVTDPRMTRFFMTIPEATHLVLQATSRAVGGEIFMLDMGEPVPITSLAEQMIRASGRVPDVDIEIKVVGTRPGEKLEERLVDDHEVVRETDHPSLLRVESPSPRGAQLHEAIGRVVSLGRSSNAAAMTQALLALARSGVASDVAAAEERSGVR